MKNMKVNGKDCPIYEMENQIHVWNHQPVMDVKCDIPEKYGKMMCNDMISW